MRGSVIGETAPLAFRSRNRTESAAVRLQRCLMWKTALIALAVSGLAGQAMAAGCEAGIAALEQQYKLSSALPKAEPPAGSADTPATTESRGVSPGDKLKQSGGVLAPPEG